MLNDLVLVGPGVGNLGNILTSVWKRRETKRGGKWGFMYVRMHLTFVREILTYVSFVLHT